MTKRVSKTEDPLVPSESSTTQGLSVSEDVTLTAPQAEIQDIPGTNAAPIEDSITSRNINIEELVKLAHGLRQNSLYGWTGLTGEERFWKALGIVKPY